MPIININAIKAVITATKPASITFNHFFLINLKNGQILKDINIKLVKYEQILMGGQLHQHVILVNMNKIGSGMTPT